MKVLKLKKWHYVTVQDKLANNLFAKDQKEYVYSVPWFINNTSPVHSVRNLKIRQANPIHKTVTLENVSIIGSSDLIIFASGRVYCPIKEYDIDQRFKYSGNGIILSNDHMCILKKMHNHSETIDSGWKLVNKWSWNYYHFMIELATLFSEIDKSNVPTVVPILIDDVYLKVPQFNEVVNILNTQKRKLIAIKPFTQYSVNQLIIPEPLNIIPPNWNDNVKIKASDVLYRFDSLSYLKNKLLPYAAEKIYPPKIFLSRKKASKRRKYNENMVREVLERNGYTTIFIEKLTVGEQISLFKGAVSIISTSGAALTNLIYCSRGCKVLIFSNYNEPFSFFSTLGAFAGAEVDYIFDQSKIYTHSESLHNSFNVDLDFLNAYIQSNTFNG
jgi:hypothetical protein